MKRRYFTKNISCLLAGAVLPVQFVQAKTYLTLPQAKKILWGEESMQPLHVELSEEQAEAIENASGVRVRHHTIKAWRTESQGWFILDQIIGKHENIDMAFALQPDGSVRGLEILSYRETYGFEVNNPRWRAQFKGKDYRNDLKLDREIKNISGATLSCRHITDGVNRINHTWQQVLQKL